jgi:hypothetical protein
MTERRRSLYRGRAGLSERAYAAHADISRGAVQKARVSGRLVLYADGSIDAAASDARRAQATDPSMQRIRHAPSLRPVPEAAVGAVADTLREQGLPAPAAAGGMRDRSRDLVRNNPYAAKAVQAVVSNLIGTGILPRARSGDCRRQ